MGGSQREPRTGFTQVSAKTSAIARILGGAGYAVFPFLPLTKARGWSAERRILLVSTPCGAGTLWRRVRAVRRSIAASYRRRAALSDQPFRLALALGRVSLAGAKGHDKPRASLNGRPSASSSQGILVSPGGAPAPPERVGYVFPRPRAPHPIPLA